MQNPNINPQDFEIIETGHLSLNLSFKSLKSKPNPHLIEKIQSLLASQNTEKVIIFQKKSYILRKKAQKKPFHFFKINI